MQFKFEYLGIDVYPNGSVEILCVSTVLQEAQRFIKNLDKELKKFDGLITTIESNIGPDKKVNGAKVIIHNSIKEKNRLLQTHVLNVFDKFSIEYSNSPLSSLKKIIDSEHKKV